MSRLTALKFLAKPELDRFLEETISRLRWGTIAALLVIALVQPPESARVAEWILVLLFAGYNLLTDVARRRVAKRRAFAWIAVVDLAVVGLVYAAGSTTGGPFFTLFALAAAQTPVFMTLTGGLLYTTALGVIAVFVEPTLPGWDGSSADVRALSSRLVMLAVVGIGVGMLTRRLDTEHAAARTMIDEATRLEELERLRTDFVASVSHDLRTPLTAARAALGLLDTTTADRLGAEERDWLANGRRNIERLGLLIDDLLAHNQIVAGSLFLDREPLDLRVVIVETMASVHPLIEAKDQTLELTLPEPLPCEGDAVRLEQVVMNVLVNAHLHSPTGARITVSGWSSANEVHVAINDDGPGIPVDQREAVFQRFYRINPEVGGSGLGLAIARGLVELHGGRIWIADANPRGTLIRLTLPIHQRGESQ